MEIVKCLGKDRWIKENVRFLDDSLRNIILSGKRVKIGLAGGKTPIVIYERLVELDWNFELVDFYLIDERKVERENSKANWFSVSKALEKALLKGARLFGFEIIKEKSDEQILEEYGKMFIGFKGFDACVVGVGTDGHFGSIFPGGDVLKNSVVLKSYTEEFEVRERFSLGAKIILNAEKILVPVYGKEKEVVIKELIEGKKEVLDFPIKIIKEMKNVKIIFGFDE